MNKYFVQISLINWANNQAAIHCLLGLKRKGSVTFHRACTVAVSGEAVAGVDFCSRESEVVQYIMGVHCQQVLDLLAEHRFPVAKGGFDYAPLWSAAWEATYNAIRTRKMHSISWSAARHPKQCGSFSVRCEDGGEGLL